MSTPILLLGDSAQDAENEVTLANLEKRIELAQTPDDRRAIATSWESRAV